MWSLLNELEQLGEQITRKLISFALQNRMIVWLMVQLSLP